MTSFSRWCRSPEYSFKCHLKSICHISLGIAFKDLRRCEEVAEREGFEPPDPCGSTVFKTAAIDRSATSPKLLTLYHNRRHFTTVYVPETYSRVSPPGTVTVAVVFAGIVKDHIHLPSSP